MYKGKLACHGYLLFITTRKDSVSDKHNLKEPLRNNKPVFWNIASSADPKQLSHGKYKAEMWFGSFINILCFDNVLITPCNNQQLLK